RCGGGGDIWQPPHARHRAAHVSHARRLAAAGAITGRTYGRAVARGWCRSGWGDGAMMRSLLYVPAHSERFVSKAHERGADAIILDLEDSVPEASKDAARDGLKEAVASVGRNGARVLVRVNAGERQ